jgi:hypothetical protein
MKKGVGSGIRDTDPGIRIRTKMSLIPNTGLLYSTALRTQLTAVQYKSRIFSSYPLLRIFTNNPLPD